jgi:hypothetical protein
MVTRKSNGTSNGHAAEAVRPARSRTGNGSFMDQIEQPLMSRQAASRRSRAASAMMARGKDVLAGEAGGVAAAVAIGVAAALIEIEIIPGLIIGAGAILLGKLFPEFGSYVRPAVKNVVRAGFAMNHKARAVMAEASEQVQDMMAEVKHEQTARAQPAKKRRPARKAATAASELPVH